VGKGEGEESISLPKTPGSKESRARTARVRIARAYTHTMIDRVNHHRRKRGEEEGTPNANFAYTTILSTHSRMGLVVPLSFGGRRTRMNKIRPEHEQ
jgi:hypothetical protein